MKIDITSFAGMAPLVQPFALANHMAQVALDCDLRGNEFEASAQAMELGNEVAEALGPDFVLHPELRKGHDFYRHRFSIERNGDEVGWVGFLAASESPKQQALADIALNDTLEWRRDSPFLSAAADGLGLTPAQLDALFVAAAEVVL